MRRAVLVAGLMLVILSAQAQAISVRELELKSATTELLQVPKVKRVLVHDENVVTAKTTGRPDEVLVTAKQFGRTYLLCWDEEDKQTKIMVTVMPRYWEALKALLRDYPQIKIINTGEYIILAGKVMKNEDMQRISGAVELDPEHIINSVLIDTRGLGKEITDLLQRHGYHDCEVRVVGKTVYLQGAMYDKHRRDQLIKIVGSYVEPFGAKVDDKGLIVEESNLTVQVQFIRIYKNRLRNLGLDVGDIGLTATGTGTFAYGAGPDWSGTVSGGVSAALKTLKENNAAKTEYEAAFATKSGEEARVQEGGVIYKEVVTANTANTVPVDYGFIVSTVPKLLARDTIETKVDVQVSVPIQTAGDIHLSRFSTKSIYTMKPGDTIILSGLTQTVERMRKTGEPFLSKVPILGALFSSTDKTAEDTEILFMITVNWKKPGKARERFEKLQRIKTEVPRP